MTSIDNLRIKIFADGADLDSILTLAKNPHVKGFTTNPSLMRKAGVTDYEAYARDLIAKVPNKPISFEIFADEIDEMIAQGRAIASWGSNVNVKIPVTTTNGTFTGPAISTLAQAGVTLNITALMTAQQVGRVAECLVSSVPSIISVFAGRVADTGRDPIPLMKDSLRALDGRPKAELLWASCREFFNIYEADRVGCHIITVPHAILGGLSQVGKDLDEYSLETVKTFYKDAQSSGFKVAVPARRAAS